MSVVRHQIFREHSLWAIACGACLDALSLLRLDNERASNKIETVRRLLEGYADRLADQFVTVTETQVRFACM